MIVDTSALVAVWRDEAHAAEILDALVTANTRVISAASLVEVYCVLDDRRDPAERRRLDRFLDELGVDVPPFTSRQADLARQAYRDYGRGSGHSAALNFGDCFSYALAAERAEPLLFVGQDFTHTDIRPAWLPADNDRPD
ncbi:MAG: type II toxin-antitoxin system VapC family toxin [Bifidobacteriaceae bacterium]|jgi:ribonuclease VapC|nr:type II toxin-antitoxin system VapC family toxin [Bifidobacteriaceae bacterium]